MSWRVPILQTQTARWFRSWAWAPKRIGADEIMIWPAGDGWIWIGVSGKSERYLVHSTELKAKIDAAVEEQPV